jgi:DNA transformation protein and related proteins
MPCSSTFVEHALDLVSGVGRVEARRMFGGHGVFSRGVMFGLLDDDELFLRVDGETEGRFADAGCRRWVYPGNTALSMSYFRPPDEAHEDPEAMEPWARLGLEAALRRKARKDAEAAAAAARRTERERRAGAAVEERAPRKAASKAQARPAGKARKRARRP